MALDLTINIGHVLTIIVIAMGGIGVFYAMRSDIKVIAEQLDAFSNRMGNVERDLSKMTDVLVAVAKQDARLDAHEHRLDALERAA